MPAFRWGNRNRMACLTVTTGTGPYLIGDDLPGHQSPSVLDDGTVVEGRVVYGSNWECGSYTKQGLTLERTEVYESSNGNAAVDWGPSDVKVFSVTPLAENVPTSSDNSITIEDLIQTGKTDFRGLKLSDVKDFLGDELLNEGVDTKIVGDVDAGFTFHNLRTPVLDADAPTITLNLAADNGSTHIVSVAGNRQLAVTGYQTGQKFKVKLDYDEVGGRVVQWWSLIKWVNGYPPAFTPVSGGSDTFEFEVVDIDVEDEEPYMFLGNIISTERPKVVELDVTPNVVAEIETTQQGFTGGPNEFRWLSATIATDYMIHKINRTGTVTGGTFKLTIQQGGGTNYPVNDIPYDVTLSDLLKLIWAATPFSNTRINVSDGGDGADCGAKLTDVAGEVGVEFLGPDRYVGYVMSVDSTNLTGGGIYQVNTVASGSGSQQWLWTTESQWRVSQGPDVPPILADPFRLTFNGQETADISWGLNLQDHLDDVQEKLEALSNIGEGNIRVRAGVEGVYVFEFVGDLRNTDVHGDIMFADGYLPQNLTEQASGQIYGTSQNGAAPLSYNEIQVLTVSGNPTEGNVILTLMGVEFTIAIGSTAEQILTILSTGPRVGNLKVTGGPIPAAPVTIEFIEALGSQNIADSSVDTYSAGAAVIDWSILDVARVLVASAFNDGAGTYRLFHVNPIPGKTIKVILKNIGSDASGEFTTIVQGHGRIVDFSGEEIEPAQNEIQEFTITEDPLPVYGFMVIKILGKRIEFSVTSTAQFVEDLINATVGSEVVTVTQGPLPGTALRIEYIGTEGGKNQPLPIVLYPANSDGSIEWAGVPVNWGPSDPFADIPANRVFKYLEFFDDTAPTSAIYPFAASPGIIIGKEWFHTGEGGGGGDPPPVEVSVLPGYNIEIDQTTDPDTGVVTSEIHNYWTTEVLLDGPTILWDLDPEKGGDKVVTIAGNRNVDCINEEIGKEVKFQVVQGGTGGYVVNFLFEVEWLEGFKPVQTEVVGKSDEWHFLCVRKSGPYVTAKFKAWVETTERPQPLEDTAGPTAANEVQRIHISPVPTGGTWRVGFNGATSNLIPYNANATTIRLTMQAMPTIGAGNLLVSGGRLGVVPIRLEFVNALGGQNLPQVIVETQGLQF